MDIIGDNWLEKTEQLKKSGKARRPQGRQAEDPNNRRHKLPYDSTLACLYCGKKVKEVIYEQHVKYCLKAQQYHHMYELGFIGGLKASEKLILERGLKIIGSALGLEDETKTMKKMLELWLDDFRDEVIKDQQKRILKITKEQFEAAYKSYNMYIEGKDL